MIGKGVFGKRFGGLLDYIADGRRSGAVGYITHASHEIGGLYYANLAANTPESAAREMEIVARRSNRVKNPVFQLIISLHPEESHKTSQDLLDATRRVIAKLGLAAHQSVCAVHLERDHKHCHAAINRVGPNGKAWEMWRSADRIRAACREVERELGFTPHEVFQARVDRQREHDQRSARGPWQWTPRQLRIYERTGVPPKAIANARTKLERLRIADKMRPTVAAIMQHSDSWAAADKMLAAHGLSFVLYQNSSRRGLQIAMKEGGAIAASAVDRNFSLAKMEARWGRYHLIHGRSSLPRVLPPQVAAAQARLHPTYIEEVEPKLEERSKLLKAARDSETAELAVLRVQLHERVQRLKMPPTITAAMTPFAVAEYAAAVEQVRETYRHKRDDIRKQTAIRTWLDFLRKKAKSLVQDAITILGWLCSRLGHQKLENKLVASNALVTPPEPFGHRDFTHSVSDVGVVEYRDRLGQLAFIDRGDEIAIVTNDEGRPAWDTMGAALQHADMKWGGCSSRGTKLFREVALDVANDRNYRAKLMERFPADASDPFVSTRRITEKEQPGTPVVQVSPPSIASLRRYR